MPKSSRKTEERGQSLAVWGCLGDCFHWEWDGIGWGCGWGWDRTGWGCSSPLPFPLSLCGFLCHTGSPLPTCRELWPSWNIPSIPRGRGWIFPHSGEVSLLGSGSLSQAGPSAAIRLWVPLTHHLLTAGSVALRCPPAPGTHQQPTVGGSNPHHRDSRFLPAPSSSARCHLYFWSLSARRSADHE